jgi:flagellar hook-basal body complex protein FliE
MTDPLGLIGGSRVTPTGTPPGGATGPDDPNKPSFKDALLRNLDEVNQLQQDAVKAVEDQAVGKGSLENVISATNKADLAFKMIQAVRNQVIKAYEDIQQMRV